MAIIHQFTTTQDLTKEASMLTAGLIAETLENSDYVNLILSGGRLATKTYPLLADDLKDINPDHVHVAVGDERYTELSDPESNWGQINQALLSQFKVPLKNQVIPDTSLDPTRCIAKIETDIDRLGFSDNIDVLWLGMGEDGHTMSLFPNNINIIDKNDKVIYIENSPKPPKQRISLSLGVASRARNCIILASGKDKAEIFRRVQKGDRSLPITRVIEAIEVNRGTVNWFIDNEIA